MPQRNSPIQNALWNWLSQVGQWNHKGHLTTCIGIVVAMIETGSMNLTKWIPYIPTRGQYAQSQQRRLSRWLHNPRINVHQIYGQIITAALAGWSEDTMYYRLDTSLFWSEHCLIRLAIIHRGRAIPIVWRTRNHGSAAVGYAMYQELIAAAARRIPTGVKVILLADRGFIHTELMEELTEKRGWHYRVRLKNDCFIWPGQRCYQLKDYHLQRGQALCLHHVRLHKGQSYGPVHLILGRNNINGEFWAVVSDEPTDLQTFKEYGLRFDIEESFLDDQSGAWHVQHSQIRSVRAVSRLFFLLAVTSPYLTAQGVAVVEAGIRRWVDPHWERGNSYLRIGWNWVKSSVVRGFKLLRRVYLTGNHDPEPAMASRQQYEKRRYRLEFQVQIYYGVPS